MSIQSDLYELIKSAIGVDELVFADQNAPRPPLPYWTMSITPRRTIGGASYSQGVDINGDQSVRGVVEATVQLQRFGDNSASYCADLSDSLSRTTISEDWQLKKIALYDVGPVLSVPYRMDGSSLEPRAIVDLFVRFGTELLDRVGIIDTVIANSEYVTSQATDISDVNADIGMVITVQL